jgi:replication fork clamp-binding protein CrfC
MQNIDAAIQSYIAHMQKPKLRQQLKVGAIHHAERDRQLTDNWFALEEEVWQQRANMLASLQCNNVKDESRHSNEPKTN